MRLLATENIGGRIERWWLHAGDDGRDKITVETVQDVEPVFNHVTHRRDDPKGRDLRYVATIPATVIEELTRIHAERWGIKRSDAFREIMGNQTDRAQKIWLDLLQGRDYRKFQAAG